MLEAKIMDDFARELWIYIWDCGLDLRQYIKETILMYVELKNIEVENKAEEIICSLAYNISYLTNEKLPDHLHARMIMNNNEWVKKYISLCIEFDDALCTNSECKI